MDSVGNDKLLRAFQRFGTILSVWVARSPKGFAFVEYVDYEDAVIAVDRMDGKELFESVLKVELATTYSRRAPPKRPEDRKNSFRRCPSPPGPARMPSMRDAAAAAANPYNRSALVHIPGTGMVLQTPLPSYPTGYDNGSGCITPQMALQQAQWYQAQQLLGQQYAGTCLPPGYHELQAQTAITPYNAATNGATNYVSYPQTPGMLTNYGFDQTLATQRGANPEITSPNSNYSQSMTSPNATYSQAVTPVGTPAPYSQPQISTRDGHATSSPANQGLMNFHQDNRYSISSPTNVRTVK